MKRSGLTRLAAWSHRRRWLMVGLWVFALVATITVSQAVGGDYQMEFKVPGAESQHATELLQQHLTIASGDSIDIVVKADNGIDDPSVRADFERLLQQAGVLPHVAAVVSPYTPQGGFQVSTDRKIAFATLQLDVQSHDMPKAVTLDLVSRAEAASHPGFDVQLSGFAVREAQQGGVSSEGIGLLVAALILLFTFGSLLAAGLPLLIAIFGLGIATALIGVFALVVQVPSFAPQVAAMIGIGVGVDYVLFIVTRYRSELHNGLEPTDAVVRSISTAGRAVMFAGCTVIISLLGLFIIGLKFLQGVAISAAAGVLIVMVASVTLLPAVLGFVGRNIDKLHVPFVGKRGVDDSKGFWYRWSRIVQRRPWPAALAGLAILIALALPVITIRLGFPDSGNDPTDTTTRKAYDLLTEGFGPGFNGPLLLVAELPNHDGTAQLGAVRDQVAATPGIAAVTPPFVSPDGAVAIFRAVPTTSPQAAATSSLIHHLRSDVLPAATAGTNVHVSIGGITAASVDESSYLAARLPWFIGVVVFLSFMLLMIVFRSIMVAAKAAVMNVLSILAAYGVTALALKGTWFGHLIGIKEAVPLPAFIPMMMFAILFGLSMDYEVFLLSRVREEYLRTGDNASAVANGLATTARVITAAALIMVSVFLAFVLGDDVFVKAIGIGMAAAIFVDATVVRLVLVPSTMELLGDRNWWLPTWLDRIIPEIHIEATDVDTDEAFDGELEGLLTSDEETQAPTPTR